MPLRVAGVDQRLQLGGYYSCTLAVQYPSNSGAVDMATCSFAIEGHDILAARLGKIARRRCLELNSRIARNTYRSARQTQ